MEQIQTKTDRTKNRILLPPMPELESDARRHCFYTCGFSDSADRSGNTNRRYQEPGGHILDSEQGRADAMLLQSCLEERTKWYSAFQPRLLYSEFSSEECEKLSALLSVRKKLEERGLIEKKQVQEMTLFLLSLKAQSVEKQRRRPEPEEGYGLNAFFQDAWQNAYLSAAKDWFVKQMRKQKKPYKVSGAFGPGFYGIDLYELPNLVSLLRPEKIGVRLSEQGALSPAKSLLGILLCSNTELHLPKKDCGNCMARGVGCRFCGE